MDSGVIPSLVYIEGDDKDTSDVVTITNNGNEHDHAQPVYVICQKEEDTINNATATDGINHVYLALAENTNIGIISNVKLEQAFFIPDNSPLENVHHNNIINDDVLELSLHEDRDKPLQNASGANRGFQNVDTAIVRLVSNSQSTNNGEAPFFNAIPNTSPLDTPNFDSLNMDVLIDPGCTAGAIINNSFQYTDVGLENNGSYSMSKLSAENKSHVEVGSASSRNNLFVDEIEESLNLVEKLLKTPEQDMTHEDIISALGDDCWKQLQVICEPLLSQCTISEQNVDNSSFGNIAVPDSAGGVSLSYDDIHETPPGDQLSNHSFPSHNAMFSSINGETFSTYKNKSSLLDLFSQGGTLQNIHENLCKPQESQFEVELVTAREINVFASAHRSTFNNNLCQPKSTLSNESIKYKSRKIEQHSDSGLQFTCNSNNNFSEKNITFEISKLENNTLVSSSIFNGKIGKSEKVETLSTEDKCNKSTKKKKHDKSTRESVHKNKPKHKSISEISDCKNKTLLYRSSKEFKKSEKTNKFYIYSESHDGDHTYLSTCIGSVNENVILYDCNFCSFKNRRWCITRHLKETHSDRWVLCDLCSDKIKCSNLLIHFWKVHKFISKNFNGKYKCEECNFVGSKYVTYQNHWLTHRTGYQCNICKMIFDKRVLFDQHKIKIHSEENNHSCKLCFKKFLSFEKLHEHKTKVHQPKLLMCRICKNYYSTKRSLLIHVRKVHENKKCTLYTCNECNRTYKSKTMIRGHLSKHLNIALYACKICKKKFFFRSHLIYHNSLHRKKKFNCEICSKKCNRKDNLKLHMRNSHFIYS